MFVLPPAGTPGRHALYLLGVCTAMTLVARGTMETYAIFLLPLLLAAPAADQQAGIVGRNGCRATE